MSSRAWTVLGSAGSGCPGQGRERTFLAPARPRLLRRTTTGRRGGARPECYLSVPQGHARIRILRGSSVAAPQLVRTALPLAALVAATVRRAEIEGPAEQTAGGDPRASGREGTATTMQGRAEHVEIMQAPAPHVDRRTGALEDTRCLATGDVFCAAIYRKHSHNADLAFRRNRLKPRHAPAVKGRAA